MSWNLAVEAFPLFASKNYISQDSIDYGTWTVSEMQSLLDRIIDGDPLSYWAGSTADDTVDVTFILSFMQGSAAIARSPDLIVLQNINWKNFVGYWSADGVTYTTIATLNYASGTANNAATDLIVNPSDIASAKFLKFVVSKTISANQAKKCGGIIACLGAVQLSGGFLDYKPIYRETVRELALGDGSLSREYIPRSAHQYDFWGATFDCPVATAAELLALREIKASGDPFIIIPEPGDTPRDAYLCHFGKPWKHGYENEVRSVGYRIPMEVKEVGSH